MASIERGGVASFYINGAYYEVGADIEVKAGGEVRTPVIKSDGVAGFTTKWVAPEVTLEMIDGGAVSLTALKAVSGQTVQISLKNGKQYQLYSAFQIDDPSAKIGDGKITGVKFSGKRCQELLSAS